ncbi:MAG: TlpA disulfide reductase family protein [Planctomycetales bacterium]
MSLWLLGRKRGGRRAVYSVGGLLTSALLLPVCLVALAGSLWPFLRNETVDLATGPGAVFDASQEATNDAAPRDVSLREAGWGEVQKMVAARRGKVVAVDVWMSTCLPCLERLPHFVAIQERFGDDVACISVNCDYVGLDDQPVATYRADALAELRKQDAGRIENVLLTDPLLEFMERAGVESTPTLFLYARDGRPAKRFDNANAKGPEEEFTAEQVETEIRRLVEESRATDVQKSGGTP